MNYFEQISDRLYTSALQESDVEKWYPFFQDNDSLDYLGLDLSIPSEELAKGWISAQFKRYKESGFGHLAIRRKEDDVFIGLAGLIPRHLDGVDYLEIAYSFLPAFWGKGYATEIASMLKTFAQIYLGEDILLVSLIHPENTRSANVALKNGMQIQARTTFMDMPVDIYSLSSIGSV